MVEIALIEIKLNKNRLRQFKHICRRHTDAVVRRNDTIINIDNIRGKGKPKLALNAIAKKYIIGLSLGEHLTFYRAQQHKKIHVIAPIDLNKSLI